MGREGDDGAGNGFPSWGILLGKRTMSSSQGLGLPLATEPAEIVLSFALIIQPHLSPMSQNG